MTSLYHRCVENFKRTLITNSLNDHDGNRSKTAETLGLQRTYLHRLIVQLGISTPPPRRNWKGERRYKM